MSDQAENVKQFLDELHATGLFTKLSRSDLEAYWMATCEFIGNRLLSAEKSVPCYLFDLVALPVRPDWQEVLSANIPRRAWGNLDAAATLAPKDMPPEEVERLMPEGFLDKLTTPQMLVFNKGFGGKWGEGPPTFGRLVYVQHRTSWERSVCKVESHRRKVLGLDYAQSAFNSIRRQKGTILKLLLEWRWSTRRPLLEKLLRGPGGLRRMLFGERRVTLRPGYGRPRQRKVIEGSVDRPLVPPEAIPAKDGQVPALPDIRPEAEDVRDTGQRIPQPGDGTE